MKKTLSIMTLVVIVIFCTNCGAKIPTTVFEASAPPVSIDSPEAKLLVRNLKKIRESKRFVYKNKVDHIALRNLLTNTDKGDIQSVRFLFGGIKGIDRNGKERMMLTTIVQISRKPIALGGKPPVPEYYRLSPEVCPPPYDGTKCPLESTD